MTAIAHGWPARLARISAAWRLLLWAAVAVCTAGANAQAQNAAYLSDLPQLFPTAYAHWKQVLPYAITPTDWLARFQGVSSPLRDISFAGARFKFGSICVPHDCGDNSAGVLFPVSQSRIVAIVQLNSAAGASTTMFIGGMNEAEARCIRSLMADAQRSAC